MLPVGSGRSLCVTIWVLSKVLLPLRQAGNSRAITTNGVATQLASVGTARTLPTLAAARSMEPPLLGAMQRPMIMRVVSRAGVQPRLVLPLCWMNQKQPTILVLRVSGFQPELSGRVLSIPASTVVRLWVLGPIAQPILAVA